MQASTQDGAPSQCVPAQPGCASPAITCKPASEQKGSWCWSCCPGPGLGPESIQGGQRSYGPSGTALSLPGPPDPWAQSRSVCGSTQALRWSKDSALTGATGPLTSLRHHVGPVNRPWCPRLMSSLCRTILPTCLLRGLPGWRAPPAGCSLSPQTVGTSDPASGPRADSGDQAPQTRAADSSVSPLSSEARAQSPDGAGLRALGAPGEGASALSHAWGCPVLASLLQPLPRRLTASLGVSS